MARHGKLWRACPEDPLTAVRLALGTGALHRGLAGPATLPELAALRRALPESWRKLGASNALTYADLYELYSDWCEWRNATHRNILPALLVVASLPGQWVLEGCRALGRGLWGFSEGMARALDTAITQAQEEHEEGRR